MKFKSKSLIETARQFRKNQTYAEKILWKTLRGRKFNDLKFRRQHPVGSYIIDFYCCEFKLAIELDGEVHLEEEQVEKDRLKDEYLRSAGIKILRIKNEEVFEDIDSVLEKIKEVIEE